MAAAAVAPAPTATMAQFLDQDFAGAYKFSKPITGKTGFLSIYFNGPKFGPNPLAFPKGDLANVPRLGMSKDKEKDTHVPLTGAALINEKVTLSIRVKDAALLAKGNEFDTVAKAEVLRAHLPDGKAWLQDLRDKMAEEDNQDPAVQRALISSAYKPLFKKPKKPTVAPGAAAPPPQDPTLEAKIDGWGQFITGHLYDKSKTTGKEFLKGHTWRSRLVRSEPNLFVPLAEGEKGRVVPTQFFLWNDKAKRFVDRYFVRGKDGAPLKDAEGKYIFEWIGPSHITRRSEVEVGVDLSRFYAVKECGVTPTARVVLIYPGAPRVVPVMPGVNTMTDKEMEDSAADLLEGVAAGGAGDAGAGDDDGQDYEDDDGEDDDAGASAPAPAPAPAAVAARAPAPAPAAAAALTADDMGERVGKKRSRADKTHKPSSKKSREDAPSADDDF